MVGRQVRGRSFPDFLLDERVYPRHDWMARHGHDDPHFSYIVRGSFTERIGRTDFVRERGSLIFRPSGTEHSVQVHEAPAGILRVRIKSGWLSKIEGLGAGRHPDRIASETPIAQYAHQCR